MSKRVLVVFGTRPEAIKMAPVLHALGRSDLEGRLCVSAQHRSMLDQMLRQFQLTPHHDLDLMRPGQDLASLSSRLLEAITGVLRAERPDVVLVHGDTTTSMATTLAAFYERIPVGHVEAGLRSGDLANPFPEEANRLITDRLARFLFAPTAGARQNLLREGVPENWVTVTGNTVIDALLWMRDRLDPIPTVEDRHALGMALPVVMDPSLPLVLITVHRRESFGEGFVAICQALRDLALGHPDVHFVYPVHLNPNVRGPVGTYLCGLHNMHLLEPLDYSPFVRLMDRCLFILTDSGGIQEEAPSLGKPVLVLRTVTERPEAMEAGTAILAGTSRDDIVAHAERLFHDSDLHDRMRRAHNPYGDGQASERIVQVLRRELA